MDCRHRVLIVDDHPVVLYGLRFLLKDSEQFAVCGEAGDVATAQEQVEVLKPDFAILDLVLGGRDGLDLVSDLLALAPRLRILVYSSQNEWRFARRCLAAGAQGYVSKSEGLGVVAQALAVIAGGKTFVGEAVRRKLAEAFDPLPGSSLVPMLDQLSDREHQVLRLLGEGQTGREIAEALAISVKTVGTYFERIKEKLQLTSLRDLETFARDQATRHVPS